MIDRNTVNGMAKRAPDYKRRLDLQIWIERDEAMHPVTYGFGVCSMNAL